MLGLDRDSRFCDYREEQMARLRAKSQAVATYDPLTIFVYSLMRDKLPAGDIEELALEARHLSEYAFERKRGVRLTNGWLAKYALDVAERIRSPERSTEPE